MERWSLVVLIKILYCVPQMNKNHTGFKRHGVSKWGENCPFFCCWVHCPFKLPMWVMRNIQTVYHVRDCSVHHRSSEMRSQGLTLSSGLHPKCLLIHVCVSAPARWMGEGGMNEGHRVLRKNGRWLPNAVRGGKQDGKCEQPKSLS